MSHGRYRGRCHKDLRMMQIMVQTKANVGPVPRLRQRERSMANGLLLKAGTDRAKTFMSVLSTQILNTDVDSIVTTFLRPKAAPFPCRFTSWT